MARLLRRAASQCRLLPCFLGGLPCATHRLHLLTMASPHPTVGQDAVSDAYDRTLAQIHAWVVRAGIKTGMMALPSRDTFLASIGETGALGVRVAAGTHNCAGVRVVANEDGRFAALKAIPLSSCRLVRHERLERGWVQQWGSACCCGSSATQCTGSHQHHCLPLAAGPALACRAQRAGARRGLCGRGAQAGGHD